MESSLNPWKNSFNLFTKSVTFFGLRIEFEPLLGTSLSSLQILLASLHELSSWASFFNFLIRLHAFHQDCETNRQCRRECASSLGPPPLQLSFHTPGRAPTLPAAPAVDTPCCGAGGPPRPPNRLPPPSPIPVALRPFRPGGADPRKIGGPRAVRDARRPSPQRLQWTHRAAARTDPETVPPTGPPRPDPGCAASTQSETNTLRRHPGCETCLGNCSETHGLVLFRCHLALELLFLCTQNFLVLNCKLCIFRSHRDDW
jgi:hypothetical protein